MVRSRKTFKKYLETNENENTTTQNLWGTVKVDLRGEFIALQVYHEQLEQAQIRNLPLLLKELEKEQQTKPQLSRRNKYKEWSRIKNIVTIARGEWGGDSGERGL